MWHDKGVNPLRIPEVYAPNGRAEKFVKQQENRTERKNRFTIIVEISTFLSQQLIETVDQKISKGVDTFGEMF